jgi:imidazolonepropionase-like amidohydrolase
MDKSPQNALVAEMGLLIENGMTSAQALHAATVVCPELVGKGSELGKLPPGYRADMIAVQGNPLEDVQALKQVHLVIKNGEIVMNQI